MDYSNQWPAIHAEYDVAASMLRWTWYHWTGECSVRDRPEAWNMLAEFLYRWCINRRTVNTEAAKKQLRAVIKTAIETARAAAQQPTLDLA